MQWKKTEAEQPLLGKSGQYPRFCARPQAPGPGQNGTRDEFDVDAVPFQPRFLLQSLCSLTVLPCSGRVQSGLALERRSDASRVQPSRVLVRTL